ncbi:hypothetical protein RAK27_14460 [Carnobacterium maltaromaticum]|uniref:Lipoprotein n=1 Tax=Carnobacterium maltaromaticum TaxID=2751 RepID=A0AAW9K9N8_CARML|nr:hypothetical protein [Carnobacterium maltaromaticum]MDZ5759861.1 hypothetical protein [Carnobacterium maltaromaticum]
MKATKVFEKKVIGIVVVAIFMLAGCGNKGQEAYDTAMEKGIQSVVSEEYAKAEVSFELALESNKEDKKATLYLNQVQNYVQAKTEFDKKDYSIAQKTLEKVLKSKDGLKQILKAADKLNQEIEAIQKEVSENEEKLTEATRLTEAKSYQESNGILDQILKQDLDQMASEFKEKCEALKQKNDTALEEIIQQEKETKEAAEAVVEDTPKEETSTPVIEESKSPAVDDIAVKKQHITDKFFAENPEYVGMILKIEDTGQGEDTWYIYANDSANGHTYWQGKYFTAQDTILGGSIGGDY